MPSLTRLSHFSTITPYLLFVTDLQVQKTAKPNLQLRFMPHDFSETTAENIVCVMPKAEGKSGNLLKD